MLLNTPSWSKVCSCVNMLTYHSVSALRQTVLSSNYLLHLVYTTTDTHSHSHPLLCVLSDNGSNDSLQRTLWALHGAWLALCATDGTSVFAQLETAGWSGLSWSLSHININTLTYWALARTRLEYEQVLLLNPQILCYVRFDKIDLASASL